MFPYIEVFGRTLGTYGICSVIGIIICVAVATWVGRRYHAAFEDILMCMVFIGIGLLIGGHIMYGITHIPQLADMVMHISEYSGKEIIFKLAECFGGMVFYGGFIGATISVLLYTRFCNTSITRNQALDLFGMSIPLFHTFGRIGCFFGGCCYGKESTWGFVVHDNALVPELNDVVRIPIQLIEAGCNFIIFLILFILVKKNIKEGKIIFMYMLIYPVVRFTTEFFRGDAIRGFFLGISTSQWISIILFIIGVYQIFIKKTKTHGTD